MPLDVWAATLPIAPPNLQPASSGGATGTGTILTTFQLTSPNTGAAEFSLAVPLAKGKSSGALSTSVSNSQVAVKRGWNDNSDKHLFIDGIANLTANVPLTVQVIDSPGSGGTILTSSNIAANSTLKTPGQNVINLGVNGSVDLSSLLNSPVRTWRSGPWAVECHYQQVVTVGTSAVYTAFHVRLYQTGRIWVRAIVENGWVDIPNTDKAYTATITIGGVNVYGPLAITHYHNTGYTAEGWIGGNPQVTPIHNTTDIVNTKLVPNYFGDTPTSTTLGALTQTYTPFGNGDIAVNMTNTGPQNQIGLLPLWDALYLTSKADSRAFNSVIANAKFIRSYPIGWRGSSDSNLPCRPSIYPNYTFFGPNTGGGQPPGAGTLIWDSAHHGSAGYLAYLLTGDYFHLETMQLQSATGYLSVTWNDNYPNPNASGTGGTNRSLFAVAVRAPAWIDRTIGQYCAIAPADSVLTDYQALLATQGANAVAVTQLAGVNQLGIIYEYDLFNGAGTDISSISIFMHWFMVQAFGHVSDLEPLTSMTNWNTARDWLYKIPTQMLGDGTGTTFCYSQAAAYFDYNFGNGSAITGITDIHWPVSWNAVWSQTVADALDNANAFTLSCGTSLLGTSGSAPATGGTSFWANLLPAIALAVDHGATNASAGWSRFTGAANWLTLRNAVDSASSNSFADFPNFGIQPRDKLIALLATMAPGTVAQIPSSTFHAAEYSVDTLNQFSVPALGNDYNATLANSFIGRPDGIFAAWGGATVDTVNNALWVWGGGHTDWGGNEVYRFSFATLKWERWTTPSNPAGQSCTGDTFPDGNPNSVHTYGRLVYYPPNNSLIVIGGGTTFNNGCGISNDFPDVFEFKISTRAWSKVSSTIPFQVDHDMLADWDSASQAIYCAAQDTGFFRELYKFTYPGTWTLLSNGQGLGDQGTMCGTLSPGGEFMLMNPGFGLETFNLTTGASARPTASGDLTAQNYLGPNSESANGLTYDTQAGCFTSWVPGQQALWKMTGTGAARTWTKVLFTGDAVPAEPGLPTPANGVFGRFRYLPPPYDCYIGFADPNANGVVFKKPAGF